MAVTTPEYATPQPAPAMQPAAAQPPKMRPITLIAAAAGVAVLLAAAIAITASLVGGDAKPAAGPPVPVIENISRPNAACTPAADKKLGLGDDLSKIYWFGWLDGKQADMPVGQALTQRIAGHEVRDAWYCPPRADW